MEADKKHHGTGNFVPESVRIVDFNIAHRNLLVRGSSAFGAGNFTMADFIAAIQGAPSYAQTGITVSATTPPLIIDFCLIGFGTSNHKDQRIVNAEAKWFNGNPPTLVGDAGPYPTLVPASSGNNLMVYWPVFSIPPTVPTTAGGNWSGTNEQVVGISINAATPTGPGYDFAGLVPALFNALNNNPGAIPGYTQPITNAVIYVHCDSGINRTGAAVISYLMQFGSNVTALGIPSTATGTCNTLQAAQTAAAISPPQGNSPTGGVDQAVAQAYCNFLVAGSPTAALAAACVPGAGTLN